MTNSRDVKIIHLLLYCRVVRYYITKNKRNQKMTSKTKFVSMKDYLDKLVSVITCDGRNIIGTLKGIDQMSNIILQDSHERHYYENKSCQIIILGLYIIRGQNIAIIGELNENDDAKLDLKNIRGNQCKPVVH